VRCTIDSSKSKNLQRNKPEIGGLFLEKPVEKMIPPVDFLGSKQTVACAVAKYRVAYNQITKKPRISNGFCYVFCTKKGGDFIENDERKE